MPGPDVLLLLLQRLKFLGDGRNVFGDMCRFHRFHQRLGFGGHGQVEEICLQIAVLFYRLSQTWSFPNGVNGAARLRSLHIYKKNGLIEWIYLLIWDEFIQ